MSERQITVAPHGHILTNTAVWSPDGRRIVYDVRSDRDGSTFDGDRIETVDVETKNVTLLYRSRHDACCGVVTYHPREPRVVFILGPEHPTSDFSYGAARRQGVIVDERQPGVVNPLDARDLTPPFTPGALRGGSHVHVFSPDGRFASFTYEDHWLVAGTGDSSPVTRSFPVSTHDTNQRNIGISVPGHPVTVPKNHPRNHDGIAFSVLITRAVANPAPGSDGYRKAYEEGWIGAQGYTRADGGHQRHAVAFLGDVVAKNGSSHAEVFVADLPDDLTRPGDGPLQGTETRAPFPPAGVAVRRLTRTSDRRHPGVTGVRHWVRSSPDGDTLAFLMRDDAGVSQLFLASPRGGLPRQLTRNAVDIGSAFTFSPDGRSIAHVLAGQICLTDVATGDTRPITAAGDPQSAPLPLACVFSPDGRRVAYLRRMPHKDGGVYNQIFAAETGTAS